MPESFDAHTHASLARTRARGPNLVSMRIDDLIRNGRQGEENRGGGPRAPAETVNTADRPMSWASLDEFGVAGFGCPVAVIGDLRVPSLRLLLLAAQ